MPPEDSFGNAPKGEFQAGAAQRTPARRAGPWIVLAVVLLAVAGVAAFLLWPRTRAADPLDSLVVSFQRQNRLTVFKAQVATVTTSQRSRFLGLAPATQVAVIPASIEYRLDLAKLTRDDFAWDPQAKRMRVTLAPLVIEPPNLDEARARYVRSGMFVSATTQEALSRENSAAAQAEAVRLARAPDLLRLARAAARAAMERNVALPLRAAYPDATVEVRFLDDPTRNTDRWDYSRSLPEVLGNGG